MKKQLAQRILLSIAVGISAGFLSTVFPGTVPYKGVQVGDLGTSILGLEHFFSSHSAYIEPITYAGLPAVMYPFTTMLFVGPFMVLPLKWIGPIFCGLTSFVFAYALLYDWKPWRLLVLASVPYLSSLQSIQFAPLLTAAYYLPFLLPLVVIKPQLGLPLLTTGNWSRKTLLTAAVIVLISLIVYPAWPFEWFAYGNLSSYEGRSPLTQGLGFLLLLSAIKWRDKRARLLLTMAIIPQRLWYDQLMIFAIPMTRIQLLILLIGSWLSPLLSLDHSWLLDSGRQDPKSWWAVVSLVYLPALCMVFEEEIKIGIIWIKGLILNNAVFRKLWQFK